MADKDIEITQEQKEQIVAEADKTTDKAVKVASQKKISSLEDAVASIAPDATFHESKDELTIKVPLASEEEKQKLMEKLVAQKMASAQAEAERLAEEKVQEEIRKMAARKAEEALKKVQVVEEPKQVKKESKPEPKKVVNKEEPKPEPKKVQPKPVVFEKKTAKKVEPKVSSTGNLKVTLVKSLIGTLPNQRKTAKALGLSKKISSYTIRPNNAVTNGMIDVVRHLVKVEEV